MNKTFKTIWNEALSTWIPVAEIAKTHGGKTSGRRLANVAKVFGVAVIIAISALVASPPDASATAYTATVNAPTLLVAGDTVTTAASYAYYATAGAVGSATGTTVTTTGMGGHGAFASAGGKITLDGFSATVSGLTSRGAYAQDAGSSITFSGADSTLTTTNSDADGLSALISGSITVNSNLTIKTGTGSAAIQNGNGIYVATGGQVALNGSRLDITTTNRLSLGFFVAGGQLTSGANTAITINTGTADATVGGYSYGISAQGATSIITLNGANTSVTTTGNNAVGVYSYNAAKLNLAGGTYTTSGASADGFKAEKGAALLTLAGANSVTTSGKGSNGIVAKATAIVTVDGSVTVNTSGADSNGLLISDVTSAINFNTASSSVTTSGANSHAISVTNGGGKTFDGQMANILPTLLVSGAGSALFNSASTTAVSSSIVLSDQTLAMSMTTGSDTWGAKAETGGVIYFLGASNTGGTGLWGTGSGVLGFGGTATAGGSDVKLEGTAVLNGTSLLVSDLNIGSLESADATTNVKLGGKNLVIGSNNASNNGTIKADADYSGAFTGVGKLTKTGTLTQILSGVGNSVAEVEVNGGTLQFKQAGDFTTSGNYTTTNGGTSDIGLNGSTLKVGGAFTQATGSNLHVTLSTINNTPAVINAVDTNLAGTLNIAGFSSGAALTPADMQAASTLNKDEYHIIVSTNAIAGDFTAQNIGAAVTAADYLLVGGHLTADKKGYDVGLDLAWTTANPAKQTNTFSMANGTAFNIDVALTNNSIINPANGGTDLITSGDATTQLVLSAANRYTGATVINSGKLALSGAGDISTSNNVVVDGTFDISGVTAAGTTINNLSGAATGLITTAGKVLTVNSTSDTTYNGNFDSTSGLVKTGAANLILTGSKLYTGATQLNQGQLTLDGSLGGGKLTSDITGLDGSKLNIINGAALTGKIDPTDVTIDSASNWYMTSNSVVNNMANAGNIWLSDPTNGGATTMSAGRTLTASSWTGNGTVHMYSVLGGDSSTTDKLIISSAYSGTTALDITNAGGAGAKTVKGIEVVQASSATAGGKFVLANKLSVGGYSYKLQQGSGDGDPTLANSWFLIATLGNGGGSNFPKPVDPTNYIPAHAVYSSIYNQAGGYGEASIGTLHDRMGAIDEISNNKSNIAWGRIIGKGTRDNGASNGIYGHEIKSQTDTAAIQVGSDVWVSATPTHSRTSVGFFGTYGNSKTWSFNSDTAGNHAGENQMDAYSIGAYLTHLGGNGGYIDLVLQGSRYNVANKDANDQKLSSTNGYGVAGSVEAGKRFPITQGGTTIEPQAQAVFQTNQLDSSSFTQNGLTTKVRFGRSNDLLLRGSVRLASAWETSGKEAFSAWVTPGIYYNTGSNAKATFINSQDTIIARNNLPGLRVGAVAGIDGQISEHIQLNAKIGGDTSIDSGNVYSYTGQIGLKVSF